MRKHLRPWLWYVPLALMFILIGVASFMPARRLWGINHLAFYPLAVRITALSLIGLSFVPPIGRALHAVLSRLITYARAQDKRIRLFTITASIVAIGVFILFRSSTLLLGDGRLVADNFKHSVTGEANIVTSSLARIMSDEPIAKGTTILYYWFTKAAHAILRAPPLSAMRGFNCLLGGVFVFVLMRIVLKGRMPPEIRIWLAFLVLSSGAIELFFGYVENYTGLMLFAVLYLASGVASIRSKNRAWLGAALVCLVLAAFMHVQGSLLVPSFLFLITWVLGANRIKDRLRFVTAAIIVVVLVGTYAAGAFTKYGEYYLPLRPQAPAAGILSPSHWLDVTNELLILLPMLPLFAVMAARVAFQRARTRGTSPKDAPAQARTYVASEEAASGDLFMAEAERHFAVLILVPCLVFLIVFEPELGMARDWDLFTIATLGLVPLALIILNRFRQTERESAVSLVTMPAFVMSAVLAVSWIGVNSSTNRATDRYRSILLYDETFAPYAYETLAKHYYDQHDLKEATKAMEYAVGYSYNPRLYTLLSIYYKQAGRLDDAIRMLRQILSKQPGFEPIRYEMVLLLYQAGQHDELLRVAGEGTVLHPEKPIYHDLYGRMLIGKGRIAEGVEELLEFKRLNPPKEAVEQVDALLKRLKDEGRL